MSILAPRDDDVKFVLFAFLKLLSSKFSYRREDRDRSSERKYLTIEFHDVRASIFLAIHGNRGLPHQFKRDVVSIDLDGIFRQEIFHFAAGRFQPDVDNMLTAMGSVFSRKHASLFEFVNLSTTPALQYISDLPSSGDTSYFGAIVKDKRLYLCYYSSDPAKDYSWLIGMVIEPKSDIYMVILSISDLLDAAAHPLIPPITAPLDNYIIVYLNAGLNFIVIFLIARKHNKK